MAGFGGAADFSGIATPIALIWGRHDAATRLLVAEAASLRHGWPLYVIDDCADDPPVEQPAAFLGALRAALGVQALAATAFGGEIVDRGHARYDELRRVFNGMVDRRPALIARCGDAGDVSAAVGVARRARLPVLVYAGGHNVTGNAVRDDALTIDLRPMKGIEIDPATRTCRAGGGSPGEFDAATQQHGLAVTGGRASTTGLGGLVLGGGSGWLERACGYAVDNLLSVEIVTADGRVLTASEREHPILSWATRGGGGNFGVVTSMELRLHPVGPTVLGGMFLYPAPMAAAEVRNFRDVMAEAPDDVGSAVALVTAPDGQLAAGVVLCHAGPAEEAESALRPLREFGPPALDMVGPMPYVAVQQLIDESYPHGQRNYWTGEFLSGLPDEAIDVLCRFHQSVPSPGTRPQPARWRRGRSGAGRHDGGLRASGAVQPPHHLAVDRRRR